MAQTESSAAATYRRLLRYARPHWWIVAAAIVPLSIYAAIGTAVPLLMSRDRSSSFKTRRVTPKTLGRYRWLWSCSFAIRGTMDFLTVYGLAWVGRSVIRDLRGEVFAHYLGLPARYFDQGSSGVLISRLTYNTEQVAEAISNAIVILLRDTLAIVLYLAVMIWYSPRLTLIVAVVGPVIALVIGAMSRAFRRYSTRIQHSMGDVTKLTEQSLHGHRVVKVFEGQDQEREQFKDVNVRNFRFNIRLVAVQAMGDALTQYAVALGVAAVMYLSFSDFDPAAFIGFITAMGMLLTPLKRLININAVDAARHRGRRRRVRDPRPAGGARHGHRDARACARRGRVSRRLVPLRVGQGSRVARRQSRRAGRDDVALVGQSGSGKSTLVSLLPRFYDPEEGAVLLDGQDVRDYTLRDLRRQIALVSQDVVLFDDTIANNIAYGALAKHSRADIERAAEAAYVTEFAADRCRRGSTRASASEGRCSRAASGSASRSRARC